jgi:hypothetical protein
MKYQVYVHVLKANNEGKFDSENFEYEFQGPNLFDERKKAIAKVKDLESFFNNEMPEGNQFDSPLVAQLKGFKNFNAYSIDIFFINDYGDDYQIYGEEEELIESLQIEASYYNEDYPMTEVEDLEGDFVEVLESDLEFILR